jgi:hypothetical protein
MTRRVYNFSAGPAAMPEPVLQRAQAELLDYKGSGMSVMEMSHRGSHFMAILAKAEADLRTLLAIPDHYRVLFLQGGALGQNAAVPLNLLPPGGVADYIDTGHWAQKSIAEAQKYGARVALFGRKINQAEHQLAFIEMLRFITEGRIAPGEAVRAYHAVLDTKKIKARLPLEKDLELTEQAMSYDGSASRRSVSVPTVQPASSLPTQNGQPPPTQNGWPMFPNGSPDFERMSTAERRTYDTSRLKRRFG